MKLAITKTKKAAIPAAIERAIARAIAKNETEKAAAIAEASRLMNLPSIEEPSMERIFVLWCTIDPIWAPTCLVELGSPGIRCVVVSSDPSPNTPKGYREP